VEKPEPDIKSSNRPEGSQPWASQGRSGSNREREGDRENIYIERERERETLVPLGSHHRGA
jgi:hypothetical protein